MASENTLHFTEDNFEDEVLNADVPVLVDFWAEWCMPCKMLSPVIDKLADQYQGKAKIGKVDTDSNRNIAVQYGISAIPTLMIFKQGQLVKRLVGMQDIRSLAAALDAQL